MATQLKAKLIPIADITLLPEIQIRIKVNDDVIEEYKEKILDGADMDPIDTFVDDQDRNILGDGVHRYMAYIAAGQEKIPAFVHDDNPKGALTDALEFSIRRNGRHGHKLSIDDRSRAVFLALQDKTLKRRNDRPLAELCGVSPALVKKIREKGYDPLEAKAARAKKNRAAKKKATSSAPAVVDHPDTTSVGQFESRVKQLQEWVRDGFIDWPAVAGIFESDTLMPLLWPKKITTILLDNGTKKTRVSITKQLITRKGGDYFVEYQVEAKGGKPVVEPNPGEGTGDGSKRAVDAGA